MWLNTYDKVSKLVFANLSNFTTKRNLNKLRGPGSFLLQKNKVHPIPYWDDVLDRIGDIDSRLIDDLGPIREVKSVIRILGFYRSIRAVPIYKRLTSLPFVYLNWKRRNWRKLYFWRRRLIPWRLRYKGLRKIRYFRRLRFFRKKRRRFIRKFRFNIRKKILRRGRFGTYMSRENRKLTELNTKLLSIKKKNRNFALKYIMRRTKKLTNLWKVLLGLQYFKFLDCVYSVQRIIRMSRKEKTAYLDKLRLSPEEKQRLLVLD